MIFTLVLNSLENHVKDEYLHDDQAKQMNELVKEGECHYISRPRRFGNSLLIPITNAYFFVKK